MQLPQRFPYNPPWRALAIGALVFGGGTFLAAFLADRPNAFMPVYRLLGPSSAMSLYRLAAGAGALITITVLVMLARRLFDNRSLTLDQEHLVVPRGLFRTEYIRIPYSEITRVQEVRIPGRTLLFVCTDSANCALNSSFFRDPESYSTVKDFLQSFDTASQA